MGDRVYGHPDFFVTRIHEEHPALWGFHEFGLEEQPCPFFRNLGENFVHPFWGFLDPFAEIRAFRNLGLLLFGSSIVLDYIYFSHRFLSS